MQRSPIERIRARWVTGPRGHGVAFAIDVVLVFRYWILWRVTLRRERRG